MNRRISIGVLLLLFLLLNYSTVSAQQRLKFSVKDFSYDAFDQTARDERFKKIDGSGSLYAIVKVKGDSSDDDLLDYRFNFGNMNHLVEDHDGELWLYVQKNAKMVTISRSGYVTLSHYDLRTTLEEGKVYRMVLSAQGPVVYTQMVMFTVTPADSKARIMITREGDGQQEEVFGDIDETGGVANSLEFGTYTYKVNAMNYYSSEGRFTLNNQTETHVEKVTLRRNGAMVTLEVPSQADIYLNGVKRGTGRWSGILKAGNYTVECRQANHRPSQQTISVQENEDQTFQLVAPTPITGVLSVTSRPLDATIVIDGKEYGKTPQNIANILIGHHTVVVSKDGYAPKTEECDIRENETERLSITLEKAIVNNEPKNDSATGDKTFTVGGVSFTMKPVAGGTFMMGSTELPSGDVLDVCLKWAKPVHQVTVNDYYIGETEVTQELWQAVMGNNPSEFKGSNLPVEYVSWNDCQEFIRKLNAQTEQDFRLPTEAEWEYAARGGAKSRNYTYSGSNKLNDVAWYKENSDDKTHAVKTKSPNELGLYDMTGNVHEWCQDWYGDYRKKAQVNPTGPSSGTSRVYHGGCFRMSDYHTGGVSSRAMEKPDTRSELLGLRLAL